MSQFKKLVVDPRRSVCLSLSRNAITEKATNMYTAFEMRMLEMTLSWYSPVMRTLPQHRQTSLNQPPPPLCKPM